MKFRDDAGLDTGQIDDERGAGGGLGGLGGGLGGFGGVLGGVLAGGGGGRGRGRAMGGGGILGVLVLVAVLFFANRGGGGTGAALTPKSAGDNTDISQSCRTGADANQRQDCRLVAVVNSVQKFWQAKVQGYTDTRTVLFTGQTQTGCGPASSSTGPFYCPADKRVYIDLGF